MCSMISNSVDYQTSHGVSQQPDFSKDSSYEMSSHFSQCHVSIRPH